MSLQGYGPAIAFVPAAISLSPRVAHYVNDGNSKLLMTIHVQDQAGSPISSGKSTHTMIAECSCNSSMHNYVCPLAIVPLLFGMASLTQGHGMKHDACLTPMTLHKQASSPSPEDYLSWR